MLCENVIVSERAMNVYILFKKSEKSFIQTNQNKLNAQSFIVVAVADVSSSWLQLFMHIAHKTIFLHCF